MTPTISRSTRASSPLPSRLGALPRAGKDVFNAVSDLRARAGAGRVVVTNTAGRWLDLAEEDFRSFIAGTLPEASPAFASLAAQGFLRDRLDFEGLARGYGALNEHLWGAPTLHMLVLTLRCNHKCLYCHSSAVDPSRTDMDMSLETARRAVDFILSTPSPSLMIEFQGGEPLLNWPVLRFVVEYAQERNKRSGKDLAISLVTNLTLMTEEKLDFLLGRGVAVCTSLDGPEELHARNRLFLGGSAHEKVAYWLRELRRRYEAGAAGRGAPVWRPNALMTTTRFSLGQARAIVDQYVALGLEGMFLRPLSPVGFAKRVWGKIGYTPAEFVAFYREALDYILELNESGVDFMEREAVILLTKILKGADPRYVDLRFPAGGVLGCLAYNYDGGIFTTDEGRMAAHEGDPMFQVGRLRESGNNGVVDAAATRAYVTASTADAQPLCDQCAYKPFCGTSPEFNYETQGTFWGRMPSNGHCETSMGIFDVLFEKLRDPKAKRIFESWLAPRTTALPALAPEGAGAPAA